MNAMPFIGWLADSIIYSDESIVVPIATTSPEEVVI
jgi:hypothetical protein